MEHACEPRPAHDAPTNAEMRKRIIKLRWIGREDEAEKLCAQLGDSARQTVWAGEPSHTD